MSERTKVLVIDDNEDDRLLYRRCLQQGARGSYVICEAVNGEDGLAQIQQTHPNCVLLDYSMPGRDGVEVLKRIRAKHPVVPVVMLTGQGSEKVAVAAMQEGAQNYISKSTITSETLEHVVRMAIQHCAMQLRIAEQRESLETFTRALAHDLKEPVRTILSLLEFLNGGDLSPQQSTEHLQLIQKAAERMDALIETVHFYTRLADTEQISREYCDANRLVEMAKDGIDQLIREHGAVITCRRLPTLYANQTQMIQVLQHLLCNSIRNGNPEPRVEIAAEEVSNQWLFRVSDNGPGIAEKDTDKLFKPFKRLSRLQTQGLGMGLAICKRIVEAHGGTISCSSQAGAGATFVFTLPKIACPAAIIDGLSDGSPASASIDQLATLLMVDDNDIHIDLANLLLIERPRLRCNMLVAHDGREALDRLHDSAVDLMLLDINMPRMDGFELLEQMRAEKDLDHVAVVMCSTSTYDQDIARAMTLGACGYLAKPPEFERLRSIVAKADGLKMVEQDGFFLLLRAA